MEQVGLLKCQNTVTHAQRVEATVGTLRGVCRLRNWQRKWAQIDAEKPKAPPVHQICKETNAREKKRVRGRRSKANAQDKYESQPFTGRDPGDLLFEEGTRKERIWHVPPL